MDVMLDFVMGYVYRCSGRYIISRESGYLIGNTRTSGWLSITSQIIPGLSQNLVSEPY